MNNPFKKKEDPAEGDIVEAPSQETSVSPVPQNIVPEVTTYYTFPDAIDLIINGKRVTRIDWHDHTIYGWFRDDRLKIHINGEDKDWIVSGGDMLATDWIVI